MSRSTIIYHPYSWRESVLMQSTWCIIMIMDHLFTTNTKPQAVQSYIETRSKTKPDSRDEWKSRGRRWYNGTDSNGICYTRGHIYPKMYVGLPIRSKKKKVGRAAYMSGENFYYAESVSCGSGSLANESRRMIGEIRFLYGPNSRL